MESEEESGRANIRVTEEEARRIAGLLRYAVSLNTTAGLVSPAERRLATSTYRAVELAALVLEGKTFDEAVEGSDAAWTGSLPEDHRRALAVISASRDGLLQSMTRRIPPERAADYLEIPYQQLLELIRPSLKPRNEPAE